MDLERVSFKGTADAVRQYSIAIGQTRHSQLWEDLLLNLARDLVRYRPNRTEPRAVKRRPKPYPLLNQPPPSLCGNLPPQRLLERQTP